MSLGKLVVGNVIAALMEFPDVVGSECGNPGYIALQVNPGGPGNAVAIVSVVVLWWLWIYITLIFL